MKEVVSNEIAEFMKFAQNAAKSCAQDYDAISEDARRYTEVITNAMLNSSLLKNPLGIMMRMGRSAGDCGAACPADFCWDEMGSGHFPYSAQGLGLCFIGAKKMS